MCFFIIIFFIFLFLGLAFGIPIFSTPTSIGRLISMFLLFSKYDFLVLYFVILFFGHGIELALKVGNIIDLKV